MTRILKKHFINFQTQTPEALVFLATMIKVYGEEVSEQAARLLDLLSLDDHLKLNARYLQCFNELMYLRSKDSTIRKVCLIPEKINNSHF